MSAQAPSQALKELFRTHFGFPAPEPAALPEDGSARRLFRLAARGVSAIGVLGADRRENLAFLGFSRHFRKAGLPVPEIYAQDLERGAYLEEDLGDTTLFQFLSRKRSGKAPGREVMEVYRRAIRTLPKFQITAGRTLDYRLCWPRARFDRQSMRWDLNHFKYYFLRVSKIPFDEQALEDDFSRFVSFLLEARHDFFLYRDFQSRNIMVRDGQPWFIDYQGGRRGALQYDAASLLYDAKADLPPAVREELLECYLEAASKLTRIDRASFLSHFHGYVYIRILQAMGTYGLRGFHERKPHFLQSIPHAIGNLERLMRTVSLPVELPELMGVFRRLVGSSRLRQIGGAKLDLTVRIQSFSYKNGLPGDESGHGGGFVFDCRALPNPGRLERYAKLTGKDAEVAAFLAKSPAVGRFMRHAVELVGQSVKDYKSRNFTDLMAAFGCTGGRHRSVYCAELLARQLRRRFGVHVEVRHREQEGQD